VPGGRGDDRDMTGHRLAAAAFGAFVAFWIARAIFKWILDVDGTAYVALVAAFVLAGAVLGIAASLDDDGTSSDGPGA
jgi:hypothetical protein